MWGNREKGRKSHGLPRARIAGFAVQVGHSRTLRESFIANAGGLGKWRCHMHHRSDMSLKKGLEQMNIENRWVPPMAESPLLANLTGNSVPASSPEPL